MCSLADERSGFAILFKISAERWVGSSSLEEATFPKNERYESEKEQSHDDTNDDDPIGNRS